MKYDIFYQKSVIRRPDQFSKPPLTLATKFDLDPYLILHCIGATLTSYGPTPSDTLLYNLARDTGVIMVNHIETLASTEGKPRPLNGVSGRIITKYHQRYRDFRPMRRLEVALEDKRITLVNNYAMLPHLYRYTRSALSHYWEWVNVFKTVMTQATGYAKRSNKPQFIELYLPTTLPAASDLLDCERRLDKNTLGEFAEPWTFPIVAIWNWLSDNTVEDCKIIPDMDAKTLERINLVWIVEDKMAILRLSDLFAMKEKNSKGAQSSFYKLMEKLHELSFTKKTAGSSTVDEILEVKLDKPTVTEAIQSVADALAEEGSLSAAEYKRALKLAETHKSLPAFSGKGTLIESAERARKLAMTIPEGKMPDLSTSFDKSVNKSTINNYDKFYVNEVMDGDMAAMILALQNSGIPITDVKHEEVKDAANHYKIYKVKFTPIDGTTSTVQFQLPVIKPNGTYTAKGTQYRMDKQRVDMPIRKVRPDRVALTSYYGKVFIDRDDRVVYNYGRWLTNRLVVMDSSEESLFETFSTANVFDNEIRTPRVYSAIAQRIEMIRYKNYELNFNYHNRSRYATADQLQKLEKKGSVVCGKEKSGAIITVDENNIFYRNQNGKSDVIGTVNDLFDNKIGHGPVEVSTIMIGGKSVALGLVLAYHFGLNNLLKILKADYRTVPKGTRIQLDEAEFTVAFADETLIVNRSNLETTMILGGLVQFKNSIKRYNINNFDSKAVYLNILDGYGLTIRILKEIESLFKLFVDPITEDILKSVDEPTSFDGLLMRANELLVTDDHPREPDMAHMRIRGYERLTGLVYYEMVKALRTYNSKTGKLRKVEMNPRAVWMGVMKDPSAALTEDLNPVICLKEKERINYNGLGGRSSETMVRRNREFHPNDQGIISEATLDSGKVAITTFSTADPNFVNVRGITKPHDKTTASIANQVSTVALTVPMSMNDDPKR